MRKSMESGDSRLCRIKQVVFSPAARSWIDLGTITVYKTGSYVFNVTNNASLLTVTGSVNNVLTTVLLHSIAHSRTWRNEEGVPTYTLGMEDDRTIKPNGVALVSTLANSNVAQIMDNSSPDKKASAKHE